MIQDWVQGMRPTQADSDSLTHSWMDVLFFRLSGRYDRIEPSAGTRKSEELLGLERSSYFYISNTHPLFGDLVAVHRWTSEQHYAVSPFDTGGLAQGHIPTTSGLPLKKRRELVKQWTYGPDYGPPMDEWLRNAYDDEQWRMYIEHQRPRRLLVEEIELSACGSQAWIWEGRVHARRYESAPLTATKVFMKPGRRAQYVEWLRSRKKLEYDEIAPHLQHLKHVVVETPEPVPAARRYLEGK